MQYILEAPKVLGAKERKIIVGPADLAPTTVLRRGDFLLQDSNYDLFTSVVPVCLDDLECLGIRRRKADLGHYIGNRCRIVTSKYFILPRNVVGLMKSRILLLLALHRIENGL